MRDHPLGETLHAPDPNIDGVIASIDDSETPLLDDVLVRRVGLHRAALDAIDALPEVRYAYALALTADDLRHRANLVARVSAAVHRLARRAKRIYGTSFDGPVPVMIPFLPAVETEPRDDLAA